VIVYEAGGVPRSILDAVDAFATNIDARMVAVGNPDDRASHFATICKPGSGWHVETISAFDTRRTPARRCLMNCCRCWSHRNGWKSTSAAGV
jgi:hypothetical protein